ncbi:MarR family winged helix-turn-helix transcriptional regulator [Catellatospora vulcania]|uniref:MarR family winged helix-turn-helix transcriptional regulator n=1 Tax=Catellatospora vulcania TaxID=1460450 RepID=UPI0012D39D6C|nr:MarR family winged helix-turn-helix transcriptional regulator [Catellatospora vulcania]
MSAVTAHPTSATDGPQPFSEDEDALVRALSRLMYALPRAIDADMVREQRLPFTEFLVLKHLSEAPDRRLRMSELATASEMSISGISRIVGRLESEGFVQRVRSEHDARGWNAVLTDAGLARLAQAWPTNLASVRRHFLDHLAGLDLKTLAAALHDVAT